MPKPVNNPFPEAKHRGAEEDLDVKHSSLNSKL